MCEWKRIDRVALCRKSRAVQLCRNGPYSNENAPESPDCTARFKVAMDSALAPMMAFVCTSSSTAEGTRDAPAPTSLWILTGALLWALTAPGHANPAPPNDNAQVPPQCYVDTSGGHNACYTCHQSHTVPSPPNRVGDGWQQNRLPSGPDLSRNPWRNLVVPPEPRSPLPHPLDDWLRVDNYAAGLSAGTQPRMPAVHGYSQGAAAFQTDGFAKDGSGWVAIRYKPFPGEFWPTNGSFGDVLIRLPARFRQRQGTTDQATYRMNLALLELQILGLEAVSIRAVEEAQFGADLDGDGRLGTALRLTDRERYFGDAQSTATQPMVYPEGTEFLHALRYPAVNANGRVAPSRRFKELRYMRKLRVLSTAELDSRLGNERQEQVEGSGFVLTRNDSGFYDNRFGWEIGGWIEARDGHLRVQTAEETRFCLGCHGFIGTPIDSTFAFARKLPGPAGWRYQQVRGLPDAANRGGQTAEYAEYLQRTGGWDEYESNSELHANWQRNATGTLNDISRLIVPSPKRARALSRAYLSIVASQNFRLGRTALTAAGARVMTATDGALPLPRSARIDDWDLRLDWTRVPLPVAPPPKAETIAEPHGQSD